ncbi:DUF4279 domain-containing protein [Listeria cornellensis]|uniref:DUF4279 domain-containing protein n=1 Tax=Listeria cornellensis FSL F6-0969 TaxID=1265820 RepID=W7C2N6_9LIST|nr:DUF4279 domain-containing protein [Listeria cornellensis]EUJ26913.1 hypothetical protein PCORN_14025 [Listeria cornellensis FSL F6-0969]
MSKTTVKAEFVAEGDYLEPEIISGLMQINPDEAWRKGEQIANKQKNRRTGSWSIGTNFEESFDVNEQLSKITIMLESKKDALQSMRETYNLEYAFIITIKIENNSKPAIHFNSDLIRFADLIKAEIGVDLYIYS